MKTEKKQKGQTKIPILSVAIITFNEERIIEKTLSAIHNWVDEIVVVDSYSTDNTVNIMELFSIKLFQKEWEGYSKQKNFAISKCTGDWILILDADEVITPLLKEEMTNAIRNSGKKIGYCIPRKLYIGNRWIKNGGYYPDYQLRLFKNSPSIRFIERAVHESISLNGDSKNKSKVGYLKNPLEHYAYTDLSDYRDTMNKYARLASKEIKGKKFHMPFIRALWAFGYRYIARKGFLDGKLGYELAKTYGEYVYNKYSLANR